MARRPILLRLCALTKKQADFVLRKTAPGTNNTRLRARFVLANCVTRACVIYGVHTQREVAHVHIPDSASD
jgi:hypothetical protein